MSEVSTLDGALEVVCATKENKAEKSNRESIVGENSACVCVCVHAHNFILFSAAAKKLYCFVILNRI